MRELPCPKCAQLMSVWIAGDLELDHCGSCKGLWFDANELTRHLANIGAGRLAEEPSHGAPTKLLCPRCRDQRLEGAFLYDVPVECCPSCHGVFLDLGEVHEILGAMNPPERASDPKSSLAGFDHFALGLFVGMRRRPDG